VTIVSDCDRMELAASDATSLDVTCNGYTYERSTQIVARRVPAVALTCTATYACASLSVDLANSTALVACLEFRSCLSADFGVTDAEFQCDGEHSCDSTDVTAVHGGRVAARCGAPAGCYQARFYATAAAALNVSCTDCRDALFECPADGDAAACELGCQWCEGASVVTAPALGYDTAVALDCDGASTTACASVTVECAGGAATCGMAHSPTLDVWGCYGDCTDVAIPGDPNAQVRAVVGFFATLSPPCELR